MRAASSLGVVLCLGATGTLAYWTDEAIIASDTFTSGKLDLTAAAAGGDSQNLVGTGPNTWTYAALTITGMIPGDSVSKTVVLRNSGNARFRVQGTVTSTNDNLVAPTAAQGLQVVIVDGATATATTTDPTTGVRTGGCTAGTTVYTQNVSTTSTATTIFPTTPTDSRPTLASNDTHSVCVRVILPALAPNSLQEKSTAINLNLTATQVGAP